MGRASHHTTPHHTTPHLTTLAPGTQMDRDTGLLFALPIEVLVSEVVPHLDVRGQVALSRTCTAMHALVPKVRVCRSGYAPTDFSSVEVYIGSVDVVNPEGLARWASVRLVFGNLTFYRAVTSACLESLAHLDEVTGSVCLSGCLELTAPRGLRALRVIGGALEFTQCSALRSFDGLGALCKVGSSIIVRDCWLLEAVALGGLRVVGARQAAIRL